MPGFDIGERWKEMANANRWLLMIKFVRADITQYTIWHQSHTAPAVRRDPKLREGFLMMTDIEALSERVDTLMWGYARYGWLKKLSAVLNRLKANIDDPRWGRKIAYHRGICALWHGDRAQAIQEIEPLQPITAQDKEVALLQIQVDLHGERLGLSERISLFQRICELTEDRSDTLQYRGAHAFELLLAGDNSGARTIYDEAIALGREFEAEKPLSPMAEIWLCHLMEGKAFIDSDRALFQELVTRLGRIVADETALTTAGQASVLKAIGDANRYAGDCTAALVAYRSSFDAAPVQMLRVFEAECELRNGEVDEAFRLIRSVDVSGLNVAERADHAFTFFYISLARRDRQSLSDARDLLKAAETPRPYFDRLRLQHLVTIGEAIEAIEAQREPPPISPLLSALKTISRYAQLRPSFMGIGINFNTVIDDLVERAEDKAERERDEIANCIAGPSQRQRMASDLL